MGSLAARSPGSELQDLLPWIEATLRTRDLLNQVKGSTGRISMLVKAVKEYSFMDQAPLQEVDVHEGLENTLVVLAHKLKKGTLCLHGSMTKTYLESTPMAAS